MSAEAIQKAVELGKKMKHVFVATADGDGTPHLAAAGIIEAVSEAHISVEAWFCPGTMENIGVNPKVSVTTWDPAADLGHQMLCKLERVEETAMMDGFSPEIEPEEHLPQSERKLILRVERVIAFSHGPHSDIAE